MSATDTKDFTIGKDTYQLGSFSAREGSWLSTQFIPHMLTLIPEKVDEKHLALVFAAVLRDMPEDVFNRVRDKCLAVITLNKVPVMMQDGSGRWAVSSPSLLGVNALIISVLVFNFLPFFSPGALETLRQTYPDLSQFLPASTDTSLPPSQPASGVTAK